MEPRDRFSKFNTQIQHVLCSIGDELLKAQEKHPSWPRDIVHASSIVSEESGELTRACLQNFYENGSLEDVQKEAIQIGAMAVRFIVDGRYKHPSL